MIVLVLLCLAALVLIGVAIDLLRAEGQHEDTHAHQRLMREIRRLP